MALITITGADPLASVTALFNFLSTPAGQLVVTDFREINQDVVKWIGELIGVVHTKNVPPAPAPTDPPKAT